ncbi:MAG: ATP-grasp domain-containing protein [Clostridium lundense]|nr:ATP-grasp domain-containing protein [Clostridium lundense]
MSILITAIGKRVQLIKHLKKSCKVIGVDAGQLVPAINFVDKFYKIPKFNEEGYIDRLVEICKNEKVDFLIPLHEFEFDILCDNRNKFKDIGTILLLSNKKIINICADKLKTYKFFVENYIDTPTTYSKNEIKDILNSNLSSKREELKFPLIVKPINGMGSAGVFKVNNLRELEFFIDYIKNPIIQEYVDGKEYTIDVLCDLKGNPISIVPRERIEVRSGEVSKSKTVKHKGIIKETSRLLHCLSSAEEDLKIPNSVLNLSLSDSYKKTSYIYPVIGPYTIQCKVTSNNKIKFIEINPRFGGGVPLTFEAGVDYGKYFNLMVKEEKIDPIVNQFEEITMLRYDEAVFIK